METVVKKILKRALIQDVIEAVLYIIILSPIMIILLINTSLAVQLIAIFMFVLCLYFIFLKSIKNIFFEDNQIKIDNIFKLKDRINYISYSNIKKIELYSTPKGSSGIKIVYTLNDKEKLITINGAGCTKKNKNIFIEYFKIKNDKIIFNGF